MQNFDFSLVGTRTVLKPKRDKEDKAVYKNGLLVKEEVEIPGQIRGRVLVDENQLIIVNELGEEVGRVVVTDGVLDLVEGAADPDVRHSLTGGVPALPDAHLRTPHELNRAEAGLDLTTGEQTPEGKRIARETKKETEEALGGPKGNLPTP